MKVEDENTKNPSGLSEFFSALSKEKDDVRQKIKEQINDPESGLSGLFLQLEEALQETKEVSVEEDFDNTRLSSDDQNKLNVFSNLLNSLGSDKEIPAIIEPIDFVEELEPEEIIPEELVVESEEPQQIIEPQNDIISGVIHNLDNMSKKTQVKEEVDQISSIRKEFDSFRSFIAQQIGSLQMSGAGSGETRLEFLDDVDRATAKVDGKGLVYSSSDGKWKGETVLTGNITGLDIDGATDIGAAIADADLFIIDDGAGGTNRKVTASRIKTYIDAADASAAADDITAGDAAILLTTSSGNITIDAAANDSDIILKGTDGGADTTFLTIDGSAAGSATFNSTVTATTFVGAVTGDVTGNADTATVLATARTIGGVSFNGSANINLPGVNSAGNQNTTGSAATLTTARTIGGVSFNGSANIDLPGVNTAGNQNTSGSAATLTTARTIGGTSFNGSANIDVALATLATTVTITDNESTNENNALIFTAGGDVDGGNLGLESDGTLTYNPSTGKVTATGFVGTLTGAVTGDVTGNADTATVLATARTIGGVSFNGSANINLPGVNSAGNQNTSGSAATLTTARTIGGTSFDGSANIAVALATLATTATVSDSTANTNFPVVFNNESNALLDDTGALRYNPSTGTLLVPNLVVAGTTTQVDTVTMEAANAVVFEGATADDHETTLTIIDPTADRTQRLLNQSGYIPLLAAVTTTAITSTPEELNILDGATVVVGEINALDLGSTAVGTAIASKAVVLDSSKDYTGIRNLTATTHIGALTGNADTATALATARTIGGVSFDGSANINLPGVNSAGNQNTTGSAATLTTARTIAGVSFDGSANITLAPTDLTSVTAVAGEINALDLGSTAIGTAIASKAVILDSSKDYTGIRNLTITGEIDAATGDFSGVVDIAGATTTAAITASGIIKTDDSTAATSTTDGSLQTDGGLSVALDAVIGDDLILLSDAAVIHFGADSDVTLTHVADTGLLLNGTSVIQFNDASQNIGAPSNAILDINATDEIELNATLVDVNANLDVSGTYTGAGTMTTGGNIVIPNAGNIGSAGDTDSIAIASNGVVTFSQIPVMPANSIDSDEYIDGSIDRAHLAADIIDATKIADDAIDSEHYTDGSIDVAHMSANSVDSDQYVDGSIDTAHIADNQITLAKMAGIARGKIIYGDASGDPAVLTAGSNGQVLSSDGTDISWAAAAGATAADDIAAGDAAVVLSTSSGNITIDAAANDSDIILKGTDGGADTTFLTIDGSAAGSATFNNQIIVGDGKLVLNSTAVTSTAAELNALDGITAVVGELNALDIGSTAVGTAVASKAVILDSNKDYTGIRNLTTTGAISVDDTTDSTSGTTGSIHTDGGLGVAKSLYVGNNLIADLITPTHIAMNGLATNPASDGNFTLAIGGIGSTGAGVLQIVGDATSAVRNAGITFVADNGGAFTKVAKINQKYTTGQASGELVFQTKTQAGTLSTALTLQDDKDAVFAGNIVIPNAGNIGSAGDADAIAIASNGVVTFSQIPVMPANSIDSDEYIDGSIDRAHLSADIIDGTKIADDAIDSEHYAADSIDEEHIANDAVGSAELKTLSTLLIKNAAGSTLKTLHGAGA